MMEIKILKNINLKINSLSQNKHISELCPDYSPIIIEEKFGLN